MAIERWDPFSEMMRFRNMVDRMFGEGLTRPWRQAVQMGYTLPVDVCETNDEFLVRAACPGCRPEDLDISVKEDTVTIRGEIREPEWMRREAAQAGQAQQQQAGQAQPAGGQMRHPSQAGVECWLQEIPYGRFTRSITLPTPINAGNARAEFDNGLLVLHMPKAEEARPRRIEIRPGAHQPQQIPTSASTASGQQTGGQR